MPDGVKGRAQLEPLDIKCTSSDCDNDLHCFRRTRRMRPEQVGQCRSCGAELVNWERVRRRDVGDAAFTFAALKRELIRHHYWHKLIDEEAELHARRKGRIKLREAAAKRLRTSVGPAEPFRDGRQTPTKSRVVYYAQHALACCCRTCLEYWHGIPKGTELTPQQIDYFTDLVMRYVDERMPALTEEGEKISPRRRPKGAAETTTKGG